MTNTDPKPFREVSSRVDSDALEREILSYWDEQKIFEKSLEQNKEKELFTFYDGPPYATGKPHYGHILQSAIKDTVLRYKTMQGYYVPRRVGWDTHGLPIENIVEKELDIKSKREIEEDIEGFNKKCRETVHRYVDIFTDTLKRIGRWADYDNAYSTLDRDYMESEWWVFKQLWEQNLIYKAFRSTPYCIRCATPLSNFEVSSNYKDKDDLTVYVLLEVVGASNQYLLVWTTTPWTLPANVAVAINSDISYVVARYEDKEVILAKDRVADVLGEGAEVIRDVTADELLSMRYVPLFESSLSDEEKEKSFRVVVGEHVTADDGTGLVHMAPAFGEEDYEVGKKHDLPVLRTVDTLGNFSSDVPVWAGKNIFDANKEITKNIKERGLLFKQQHYRHSYPFCWRCDTPLIYYALDSWFVRITEIKDQMLKNNEQISWIPEHVKHGRFEKGIESAPDWAISRNRFWSVPMPVWQCDGCDQTVCVGSIEELQKHSGASDAAVEDIHRPYVDDITWACSECKGTMKRIPEVLDVWFDSGSMPYSQWHYPFDNKEFVEKGYPADFIAESIEMTRAWFYVLHVLATALTRNDIGLGTDKPAYKNVIASGIIFAEDGRKLSKKLKNYPEITPTIEQYGADILRFYLLSSSSLGEPYRFSEKAIRQLRQNTYVTLWNVYSFFVRYSNVHGVASDIADDATSSENILDQWILARTKQLELDVTAAANSYHIDTASRLFVPYIDDLSNWYVRRSRARFQKPESEEEKKAAYATLHSVLVRVSRILAPFMPFIAEDMFRNVTGKESVHLELLEAPAPLTSEEELLLEQMQLVRTVVSSTLAERAKAGIKVRQPLASVSVRVPVELPEETADMIKDEINVDEVSVATDANLSSGTIEVTLDTTVTPELKERGIAREIIRYGQVLRREAGYNLNDRITVIAKTSDETLQNVLVNQKDVIMEALQADAIVESGDEDTGQDVTIAGGDIHLGVKK